jgi:ankyrin repeat protein
LANGADVGAKNGEGQTPLHAAAASGHKSMVELLLNHQASVQAVDNNGDTPLHLTAEHGYRSVVEALLAHSAEVNAKNKYGSTPLLMASADGFKSVVDLLLAHGADINATTTFIHSQTHNFSGTPLCIAATRGDQPLVELLLSKGAQVDAEDKDGRTPLSLAAQNQSEPVVTHLLAAHANPNAGRLDLPLAEAAFAGDITILKLLLANGADPNTNSMFDRRVTARTTQSGGPGGPGGRGVFMGGGAGGSFSKFTPLFLAVNQRHADAARELLRCKANPNTSGPDGNPLLYEALSDAPTLKVLLDGGADPNARTSEGTPMLQQAVWEKNQPAVELLLAHHAEVNCTDQISSVSPLQSAASLGLKPIAELLLKAGAAVNAKGNNGETPLYAAVRTHQSELTELLLANKADPNVKNNNGWTPLHQAVGDNQPELVKLLLANKADPNERDKVGQTPLDLAKSLAQSAPGQPPGAPRAYPGAMAVPPGALPGRPPLNYQWAPGTPAPAPAQESKPEAMVDLLRRHGAADDLPRLNCIEVRRPSANYSSTAFTKGTNDWNQFTLLDLVGVQCGFLAPSPQGGGNNSWSLGAFFNQFRPLPFPDFARLRIRRPAPDMKSWVDQTVDLRPVLESGDCSKDVRLEWGDVVEIPEADHPLNESWPGFSTVELANLRQCLARQVEIVINGQATNITLAPQISGVGKEKEAATFAAAANPGSLEAMMRAQQRPSIVANTPFWLKPALLQSKLVLTSSDLRHVKVTRHGPITGQERQWVVDCSEASPAPDLWLCNGDKIEVPEKAD